jgi:hypothetical protein
MKRIIRKLSVIFVLSLFSFSFMSVSISAATYEGYGQTGFYGEYQPAKDTIKSLPPEELVASGMLESEKIPDAGDSSFLTYLLLSLLPLLLGGILIKHLKQEKYRN